MKLVALWLAAVFLAVVAAGSCSISHRSNEFACEVTRDCADGRICVDGFCIAGQVPGDAAVVIDSRPAPAVDAMLDAPIIVMPDANECPAQCTSCDLNKRLCKVDCTANPALCTRTITCPTGFSCNISCESERACRNGIDCTGGDGCTISCGASQSCRNVSCGTAPCELDCTGFNSCTDVDCGKGACNVDCSGTGSCNNVDCRDACSCDLVCAGLSNCTSISCPLENQCTDGFGGCTALAQGCDSCP